MNELPHKLKLELALVMHLKMYENVPFLTRKKEEKTFIAWIGTVIHPMNIQEEEMVFRELEPISEMYFIVKGDVAYVLTNYQFKRYIYIHQGKPFGHVDLFGRRLSQD